MVAVMKSYDFDASGRLSRSELDHLFNECFPSYVANGQYCRIVNEQFLNQVDDGMQFCL